eukprot:922331-Pleurochrysis_carterae.AAC.2
MFACALARAHGHAHAHHKSSRKSRCASWVSVPYLCRSVAGAWCRLLMHGDVHTDVPAPFRIPMHAPRAESNHF